MTTAELVNRLREEARKREWADQTDSSIPILREAATKIEIMSAIIVDRTIDDFILKSLKK